MARKPVMLVRPARIRTIPQGGGPLPPKGGEGTPPTDAGDSVSNFIKKFESFSQKDRDKILAELSMRRGKSILDHAARDLALLASAVHERLCDLGITGYGPLVVKQQLAPKWAGVLLFTERVGFPKLTSQERLAAFRMLAFILLDGARGACSAVGAPLTLKFVVGQVDHLPGLYDAQFPGYVSLGLGLVPIRRFIATGVQTGGA